MRSLLLLAAAACGSAPSAMMAPPPTMQLNVTPVLPGATLTLRLTDGSPGDTAYFFRGAAAGGCGTHASVGGNTCINLIRPTLLGNVTVNGSGRAVLTGTVPAGARFDIEHAFQVVTVDGSNRAHSRVVRRSNTDGCANPAQLSGVNMRGVQLARLDLSCADLTGANLTNADLTDADLFQADLSGATISGALFINANLSSADFTDVSGPGTVFSNATAVRTDFTNAWLDGSRFDNADLEWSIFEDAVAQGSWLENTDLDHAILTNADFSQSGGRGMSFSNSSHEGLSLRHATLPEVTLYTSGSYHFDASHGSFVDSYFSDVNATFDHADIRESFLDMVGGSARYTRASDVDIEVLRDADCTGMQGDRVSFEYTSVSNVDFTDATLVGANLYSLRMTNVDLTRADFTGARSSPSTTSNVTYDATVCPGGTLSNNMPSARCW